jgi:hypothetical protein
MLRTAVKNISRQGRVTSGVRVMALKENDVVASVAVLAPKSQVGSASDLDIPSSNGNIVESVSTMDLAEPSDLPANGRPE